MNDSFTIKVRSAAIAGWWMLLIAAVVATVQWLGYRYIVNAQPEWVMNVWGRGVMDWPTVQRLFLRFILGFRFCILVTLMIVVWLSLWARQLRKRLGQA